MRIDWNCKGADLKSLDLMGRAGSSPVPSKFSNQFSVFFLSIGTNYSSGGVLAYEQNRHGKDGELLLDTRFTPKLENINAQILLDAGCGADPWSFYAAKRGTIVYGIDIQRKNDKTSSYWCHNGRGGRTDSLFSG